MKKKLHHLTDFETQILKKGVSIFKDYNEENRIKINIIKYDNKFYYILNLYEFFIEFKQIEIK